MAKLRPEDHRIPETAVVSDKSHIPLACIAPLAFIHPLLIAPYLYPASAYTLLLARATPWIWDAPLAPLMTWLRASLFQACRSVNSLSFLNMDNHITVGRHNLQKHIVPCTAAGTASPAPNYIVHQSQQASTSAPINEENLAGHLDLQASALYRIANFPIPEDQPDIWKTLGPLTKIKSRQAF